MSKKIAIIIGAGPAGLTAAFELLEKTDIMPVVYELSDQVGGLARTVNYKGNRIDIGGHRFFSKSDRVMDWWLNVLPLQKLSDVQQQTITYQQKTRTVVALSDGPEPDEIDCVMLLRKRKSRIYFARKFFDYPIRLSADTLKKLGIARTLRIVVSYLKSVLLPIRPELHLEHFFINRFGRELYRTFFKSYTEKVWGIPCNEINAEWGRQRIKGLSIFQTILHGMKNIVARKNDVAQKQTETSLIEQFLYPKYGPGQMWEEVARRVQSRGGKIHFRHRVLGFNVTDDQIVSVEIQNLEDGAKYTNTCDYVFSTMPVKEFIGALGNCVPEPVRAVADGLLYRDFIMVGVLVKKLREPIPDNWMYIQEPDVKLCRLQIFNNWSPYMVKDPSTVWLGLEYFCNEGDDLWMKPDGAMAQFAADELESIDIIEKKDVLDSVVIRMPKTYPAYFGTYDRFHVITEYIDRYKNLFLVGRNGMHKYNNQDHSMLAAMLAVENIVKGIDTKKNLWKLNVEQEYHEEK
jgi:protoporphyrinogen oxidase